MKCFFFHKWSDWWNLELGESCYLKKARECFSCKLRQERSVAERHKWSAWKVDQEYELTVTGYDKWRGQVAYEKTVGRGEILKRTCTVCNLGEARKNEISI